MSTRRRRPTIANAPAAFALFDEAANPGVDPEQVTMGSNRELQWVCPVAADHRWSAAPARIFASLEKGNTGCRACRGFALSVTNRLDVQLPEVAAMWDHDANPTVAPSEVTVGSSKKVRWACPVAADHRWPALVKDVVKSYRDGHRGCPACRGTQLSVTNRLDVRAPALAAMWDHDANGSLDPSEVTLNSSRKVHWVCPEVPDHRWPAKVANVVRSHAAGHSGCSPCAGASVSSTNRLDVHEPRAVALWDAEANAPVTPADVSVGAHVEYVWSCPVAADHVWDAEAKEIVRAMRSGWGACPFCRNRRVSETNRLTLTHPEAAAMWDTAANATLQVGEVTSKSTSRAWFICPRLPEHRFHAPIRVVTAAQDRGSSGCTHCAAARSGIEVGLAFELAELIGGIDPCSDHLVEGLDHGRVDILSEEARLVVEYDGAYWHADRVDRDRRKVELLVAAGYTVVRVREMPLETVGDDDVLVESNPDVFTATCAALAAICRARPDLVDELTVARYRSGGRTAAHEQAWAWTEDAA